MMGLLSQNQPSSDHCVIHFSDLINYLSVVLPERWKVHNSCFQIRLCESMSLCTINLILLIVVTHEYKGSVCFENSVFWTFTHTKNEWGCLQTCFSQREYNFMERRMRVLKWTIEALITPTRVSRSWGFVWQEKEWAVLLTSWCI